MFLFFLDCGLKAFLTEEKQVIPFIPIVETITDLLVTRKQRMNISNIYIPLRHTQVMIEYAANFIIRQNINTLYQLVKPYRQHYSISNIKNCVPLITQAEICTANK